MHSVCERGPCQAWEDRWQVMSCRERRAGPSGPVRVLCGAYADAKWLADANRQSLDIRHLIGNTIDKSKLNVVNQILICIWIRSQPTRFRFVGLTVGKVAMTLFLAAVTFSGSSALVLICEEWGPSIEPCDDLERPRAAQVIGGTVSWLDSPWSLWGRL